MCQLQIRLQKCRPRNGVWRSFEGFSILRVDFLHHRTREIVAKDFAVSLPAGGHDSRPHLTQSDAVAPSCADKVKMSGNSVLTSFCSHHKC